MDRIPGSEITGQADRDRIVAPSSRPRSPPRVAWSCPKHRCTPKSPPLHGRKLMMVRSRLSTSEPPNSWEHLTTYNNFYEIGTRKSDPARNAPKFRPRQPWTIAIEGECSKRGAVALEDILKGETLEDRVYRHRCVEGWSMVIPWVGFPLANLIKRCEPTSKAKFVEFTTLHDVGQMPGQRSDVLEWPYVEGLRLDEALHPLTIVAVGLYGEITAEPERCAVAAGRAVEVRLQGDQVDCQDSFHGKAAGVVLATQLAAGIRLLRECESGSGSP